MCNVGEEGTKQLRLRISCIPESGKLQKSGELHSSFILESRKVKVQEVGEGYRWSGHLEGGKLQKGGEGYRWRGHLLLWNVTSSPAQVVSPPQLPSL